MYLTTGYIGTMGYVQGGELSAERRAFRERLRLQITERFVREESGTAVAWDLRINIRSIRC
ncbi:hypothetical protein FHS43_003373 [Streptosporangium becharense]|uniref:Uncharacterized protein n=1 Tax=Streptosporangium becharense TaxID=1816182 RepID=A0A7W9IDD2_9ACTN|nr:hypothetical protein [Streptosporangium becharense]MBB5818640.1 hypothetical protein [Streptosporangium becharense]